MHRTPYVFGIGLPKTGTMSLAQALNTLGIPTLHNYLPLGVHRLKHLVQQNLENGNTLLLDPVHTKWQGFVEFHGEHYYETLYTQYPDSVFINTRRDVVSWFNSWIGMRKLGHLKKTKQLTGQDLCDFGDECAHAITHYFEKTREIAQFFRDKPHRYLELDICAGDGWEPLCEFLNLPVPDQPFPHTNTFAQRLRDLEKRKPRKNK